MCPEVEELVDEDVLLNILREEPVTIVLYNDDHNTFDHVIDCLVKYCKHNLLQAEQCANIVHHNGKCDVKRGLRDVLQPIYEALLDNGLTAKIE